MLNLIKEIEKSLDNGNIRCALGMALTLPDICGQVEYPNDSVGTRYKKWCKNYLYNQGFFPEWVEDKKTGKLVRERAIDSEMCYLLRCAFLHSGNLKLQRKKICFHLVITSGIENGIYKEQTRTNKAGDIEDIYIDARHLCRVLCYASMEYYNKNNDIFHFHDHHIVIENKEMYYKIQEHEEREKAKKVTIDEFAEMVSNLSSPAQYILQQIQADNWQLIKDKVLSDEELRKGMSELIYKKMIIIPSLDDIRDKT